MCGFGAGNIPSCMAQAESSSQQWPLQLEGGQEYCRTEQKGWGRHASCVESEGRLYRYHRNGLRWKLAWQTPSTPLNSHVRGTSECIPFSLPLWQQQVLHSSWSTSGRGRQAHRRRHSSWRWCCEIGLWCQWRALLSNTCSCSIDASSKVSWPPELMYQRNKLTMVVKLTNWCINWSSWQ